MAVKTFEEVAAAMSADERKLFDNIVSKNPELKEGWLRQDDYSRNLNKLKEQEAEYTEAVAQRDRMQAWADRNVPIWEGLADKGIIDKETGEELWTVKQSDLEKQLSEARAQALAGGGEMDEATLRKNVEAITKEYGVVSPAELKALIESEGRKLAEETFKKQWGEKETSFNEKTIPFVAGFSTSMALAAMKYEKETGKDFTDDDHKAVIELMNQKKNYNPREVMEEYVKPHKAEKDMEALVARRVQEELAKRGMDGSGGEGAYIPQPDQKGNLKLMLERSGEPTDFDSLIAAQSVKAAGALRSEGKS